jgi:HEPN domain-containing protein
MIDYEEPPTDTGCYHCHQTAEKVLKAYLIYRKEEFHKIHDLIVLLNLCKDSNGKLDSLRDDLEILNQYYIEAKYLLICH